MDAPNVNVGFFVPTAPTAAFNIITQRLNLNYNCSAYSSGLLLTGFYNLNELISINLYFPMLLRDIVIL